jgi:hypothetical protein
MTTKGLATAAVAETLAGKSASEFVLTAHLADAIQTVLQRPTGSDDLPRSATAIGAPLDGSGTLNRIPKFVTTTTIGDSVMSDVNGRIGIGTTIPVAVLHIQGTGTGNYRGIQVQDTFTNSSAKGAMAIIGARHLNTNASFAGFGTWDTGAVRKVYIGGGTWGVPDATYIGFYTASLYDEAVGVVGNERMRITNAGNVGIGTLTPAATLHVGGNVIADGNLGIGTAATPGERLRVAGNVVVEGNIGAKYQDIAEWVDTVEPLEPGTLVVIDSSATNRVTAAIRSYDGRVAGAVSAQPGVVLGEPGPNKGLIAQSGRVRVKADATYGAIRAGDLLVSSPTKGHAMRSRPLKIAGQHVHRPGTIIGKALEALPSGRGEILVLLTLQ